MKEENKFKVLCILAALWVAVLVAMLLGMRINPRAEMLLGFAVLAWFGYWTISFIRWKDKNADTKKKDSAIDDEQS